MDMLHTMATDRFLLLLAVALLSLMGGSFLNVVIWRLPLMMENDWHTECRDYLGLKSAETDSTFFNLWWPFSHCPTCKHSLKPWHNVPLISYLILRGRCAFCRAPISPRYPLVELICCLMSVAVTVHFGWHWQTALAIAFTWIIIALTFIDLDHQLLPDELTLLLVWLGLFASLFNVFIDAPTAIIGAMAGYLTFAIIQGLFKLATGKIGMGQGDFKFLAGLGALLGWQQLPIIILLAAIAGLIFGISQMILHRRSTSIPLPFGPWLAMAGWICLLYGSTLQRLMLYYLFR